MAELEERMSEAELRRWALFESSEPFPSFRIDLIGGIIGSVLANIHKAKGAAPFSPTEFMPLFKRMMEDQKEAALREQYPDEDDREEIALRQMFVSMGGRLVH